MPAESQMPPASLEAVPERAQGVAVSLLWRQWRTLGASALGDGGEAEALIDPEALVLASLAFAPAERRLEDFACWWARVGSSLLSAQRAQRMARRAGPTMEQALQAYARMATDHGDARWKGCLGRVLPAQQDGRRAPRRSSLRGAVQPNLTHRAALMLRVRAAFGVSVKSDLFAYLTTMLPQQRMSAHELAVVLGYGDATVREALSDAGLAMSVAHYPGHPSRYGPVEGVWPFLGVGRATWRPWPVIFSFLKALSGLDVEPGGSSYVLASRMRTLLDAHEEMAAAVRAQGGGIGMVQEEPQARILGEVGRALQWCSGVG